MPWPGRAPCDCPGVIALSCDDRSAAAADMDAEIDILDPVPLDAVAVAGDLDSRGFLRHLPSAVAHREPAEHDAVTRDGDDAAEAAAVDDRPGAADDRQGPTDHDGPWCSPPSIVSVLPRGAASIRAWRRQTRAGAGPARRATRRARSARRDGGRLTARGDARAGVGAAAESVRQERGAGPRRRSRRSPTRPSRATRSCPCGFRRSPGA